MDTITVRHGSLPLLILAPHGPDDINTNTIAENIAEDIDCNAVINWGWTKSDVVDDLEYEANLNNIKHITKNHIVACEFLDPINEITNNILFNDNHKNVIVFIIHGVGNYVKKQAKDPNLDAIIGYGAGGEHTSTKLCREIFLQSLEKHGIFPYVGKANGRFAGRGNNNLNQLWRCYYDDENIQSFQIELVKDLRDEVEYTSELLSNAINEFWEIYKDELDPYEIGSSSEYPSF